MHSAVDFMNDYVSTHIRKSIGDYMGMEDVSAYSRRVEWFGFDGRKYRSYCCDEPAVIYFGRNEICYCWTNEKGHMHRRIKPAGIFYFKNKLRREEWYENGKHHRIGLAAVIYYRKCDKIKKEIWKENGKVHRQDGPAIITYRKTGSKLKEEWCENGLSHRIGGPAITKYRKTACKNKEEWFENGIRHRKEYPAVIYYDKTGKICDEIWIKRGKHFRSGIEPDLVWYEQDGTIKKSFG